MVHKIKQDEDGYPIKNKSRLVAQGYNQEQGIDYEESFAPVARLKAIRLLCAFASHKKIKLFQIDAKSVFLNRFIPEEVYVKQPPGFEYHLFPNFVYKLNKALYGLKQAPQACLFMSMMRELTFFLGLQIKQCKDGIFIHQSMYTLDLLKKFTMENCKEISTPMSSLLRLDKDENDKSVDQKLYRV
ncbi:hypothetical protein OROGR_014074 [Orobanche gracilis]